MINNWNKYLDFTDEVKAALENGDPVLAMESTILSHGLPYPENIDLANELETFVRDMGVTPATICLAGGRIKIGLESDILKQLATSDSVEKVTRRNFPKVLLDGVLGATTVAGTMIASALAGIKVFSTGGIGGVHRYGNESFDISADLPEFTKSPVIVVSAGAKAILDLPKTLEYLETLGVPVYGFKTDEFPAFYSRRSGLKIAEIASAKEIAGIYKMQSEIGYSNGILIANPIPEVSEIPYAQMETYIIKAIEEAQSKQIIGPALTPYLLQRIVQLTEGSSLEANLNLVRNNVKLGCEIAKELTNGN